MHNNIITTNLLSNGAFFDETIDISIRQLDSNELYDGDYSSGMEFLSNDLDMKVEVFREDSTWDILVYVSDLADNEILHFYNHPKIDELDVLNDMDEKATVRMMKKFIRYSLMHVITMKNSEIDPTIKQIAEIRDHLGLSNQQAILMMKEMSFLAVYKMYELLKAIPSVFESVPVKKSY